MVEIIGSTGRVTFATFDDQPVLLTHGSDVEEFVIAHPPHVQQPLIQTIVDELAGRGRCPSTAESGARASWVLDRCAAAFYGQSGAV